MGSQRLKHTPSDRFADGSERWRLDHVWLALQVAAHDLDVPSVNQPQYIAWRSRRPDTARWISVNEMSRLGMYYGIEFFFTESARNNPRRGSSQRWSDAQIGQAVADARNAGARGPKDYTRWREGLPDRDSVPAWSIIFRRHGPLIRE